MNDPSCGLSRRHKIFGQRFVGAAARKVMRLCFFLRCLCHRPEEPASDWQQQSRTAVASSCGCHLLYVHATIVEYEKRSDWILVKSVDYGMAAHRRSEVPHGTRWICRLGRGTFQVGTGPRRPLSIHPDRIARGFRNGHELDCVTRKSY